MDIQRSRTAHSFYLFNILYDVTNRVSGQSDGQASIGTFRGIDGHAGMRTKGVSAALPRVAWHVTLVEALLWHRLQVASTSAKTGTCSQSHCIQIDHWSGLSELSIGLEFQHCPGGLA